MEKQSPICPKCTGWMQEVLLKSGKWMKCNGCGHMIKISKRIIIPSYDGLIEERNTRTKTRSS